MLMTPRTRRAAAISYAFAGVGLALLLLRDGWVHKLVPAMRTASGDCIINWLGARAWQRGIDVYSADGLRWAGLSNFGHPPTTPLWYLPFTGYGVFELTPLYGRLLMLMLLVHVVAIALELRPRLPLVAALIAYALVADTSWWANHVAMIQISEPIAFLYVLAWLFLRRERDVLAGMMIGLALTLKLYAGLLVLMLLLARRWRAAAVATVVYLGFAAAATWRFGFGCWREFVKMLPATQSHWTAHIRNASIHGIVLRWWVPACGTRGGVRTAATLIATVLSIAIVAALARLSWRSLQQPSGARTTIESPIDLPFALFSTASAWLNPVVWEHYDVTLILPLAIGASYCWRMPGRPLSRAKLVPAALLVATVLLLGIDMWHKTRIPTPLSAGGHTMLHLLEVANWLPWALTLAALALLQSQWQRRWQLGHEQAQDAAVC